MPPIAEPRDQRIDFDPDIIQEQYQREAPYQGLYEPGHPFDRLRLISSRRSLSKKKAVSDERNMAPSVTTNAETAVFTAAAAVSAQAEYCTGEIEGRKYAAGIRYFPTPSTAI
jgi:hypothetical protein